jgi:transposase
MAGQYPHEKGRNRVEEKKEQDYEDAQAAKAHLVTLMQMGYSWQKAATTAGLQISRSTVYRLRHSVQTRGEEAFQDGRQGHPTKLREAVLQRLIATCRANPQMSSREAQAELQEQFDIHVSIGHLNRVRARLGLGNRVGRTKKNSKRSLLLLDRSSKKALALCSSSPLRTRHVCSTRFVQALLSCASHAPLRLAHLSSSSRQSLLRTLLFLGVAGLSRTWDLFGYTGDALGLLTGRARAYGQAL